MNDPPPRPAGHPGPAPPTTGPPTTGPPTSAPPTSAPAASAPSRTTPPPEIVVTDSPRAEEVALVSDGLNAFNAEVIGHVDSRALAVLVRGPRTGRVLGGLTGRTSMGLLFVELFHLPRDLRGSGLGGRILRQAEAEAQRRGCTRGVLYTLNFQAEGFYQRHGWQVFGEIATDPPGVSRIFMTKELG